MADNDLKVIVKAKDRAESVLIEEMAKVGCGGTDCNRCVLKQSCDYIKIANTLYNAGYCKQGAGELLRHERWQLEPEGGAVRTRGMIYVCSGCGASSLAGGTEKYCSECGARMDGGKAQR